MGTSQCANCHARGWCRSGSTKASQRALKAVTTVISVACAAPTNNNTLLSMNEMIGWDVDGERAFLAYSQANSIVDYIVAKWGKDAVLEILRQIGRDVPPETAFRSVLGLGQRDLWNRWAREGIQ